VNLPSVYSIAGLPEFETVSADKTEPTVTGDVLCFAAEFEQRVEIGSKTHNRARIRNRLFELLALLRRLPAYGTDFAAPDFTQFAAACGIASARATTLEAVRMHAERAIASRAPFLLDVVIDLREYEDLI